MPHQELFHCTLAFPNKDLSGDESIEPGMSALFAQAFTYLDHKVHFPSSIQVNLLVECDYNVFLFLIRFT